MRNKVKLSKTQLELLMLASQQQGHTGYASQWRQVAALVRHGLAVGLGEKKWLLGYPFQLTPKGLTLAQSYVNQPRQEKP